MRIGITEARLAACIALLCAGSLQAQVSAAQKQQMAEEVFKNVQVLKGISAGEFMEAMGIFSASTLLNCTDCHTKESSGDWAKYAEDTPLKRTARRMVSMVRGINQTYFNGRTVVTCYTCHRGDERPRFTPNLTEMYSAPPPVEPELVTESAADGPSVDSLLDKYLAAIGGAQKWSGITSIVAMGTFEGSPVSLMTGTSPIEIYAKAPNQRVTIIHTDAGDATTVTDGRAGWNTAPSLYAPIPLTTMTAADLDAANTEAMLMFPARLKQMFTAWRVGYPVIIDNADVQVVQGMTAARLPVKLYFDPKTGLLVRLVRYSRLSLGLYPMQTDYADYRDVNGIKLPFQMKLTTIAGLATVRLDQVQLNVPVDAARFGVPALPVAPKK